MTAMNKLSDEGLARLYYEATGQTLRERDKMLAFAFGRAVERAAPSVCDTCHGQGRVCVGTSGREDDGNAPEIEPCPTCEGESAAPLPPMPAKVAHITRRIRRCESDAPAQLVLEHFAMEYARAAVANVAPAPSASPAALTDALTQIGAILGPGSNELSTLLACIRNIKHFSDCLDAVERAFFMVPGEPDDEFPDEKPDDECLLNRWGSTVEQYVEQFRAAIPRLVAASPADQGEDARAIRNSALEEAARLIESTRETTTIESGGDTQRHLTQRKGRGDMTGMTWAAGIRALMSATPAAGEKA